MSAGVGTVTRGVVWVPNWPVVTAILHGQATAQEPIAVYTQRGIVAVNDVAYNAGVREGMRRRSAQATLPDLVLIKREEDLEVQAFEAVLRACEEHISDLVVLEPGTATFLARGAIRTAGSAEALAENVVGQVADDTGMEAHVGFADGLLAAILAARRDAVVSDAAAFLDSQPLSVLRSACFSAQAHSQMGAFISTMEDLGVRLVGDLRRLDRSSVLSRFGAIGKQACDLIEGREGAVRGAPGGQGSCIVERRLDEPLLNLDQAAFLARELSEELSAQFTHMGKIARDFTITAQSASGRTLQRSWVVDHGASRDITDRVRWQLSAWLKSVTDGPESGLVYLGIQADQLVPAGASQGVLWGGDHSHERVATRAVSRIQSLLGKDAVVVPDFVGGRHPAQAYQLRPWDAASEEHADTQPWPGKIPQPWPSTVAVEPEEIAVVDERGHVCQVSALGVFFCADACTDPRPARYGNGKTYIDIVECAGPWLHEVGWWNPKTQERKAWCEAIDANGHGSLFYRDGEQWWLSGRYE